MDNLRARRRAVRGVWLILTCGLVASANAEIPVECNLDWLETYSGAAAVDGPVHALVEFDDGTGPALYAGGTFANAGGPANNIARWDGESWSPLDAGTNGSVYGLAVYDDGTGPALFAAGQFTTAGGVPANNIAKWDGAAWTALGDGVDDWIRALQVYDDGTGEALFVGGDFINAGGAPAAHIAKWDGLTWSSLGVGVNGMVLALDVFDDGQGGGPQLYAGGTFLQAGGAPRERLARWNGVAWSFVGHVNGTVRALQVYDDGAGPALYAAGQMIETGGVPVDGIARWDGLAWTPLGAGVTGPLFHQVGALAVYDDGAGEVLYVGGSFTSAGGAAAERMARWDGVGWSALGAGIGSNHWSIGVDAMVVFDNGDGPALQIAGNFVDTPTADEYLTTWGCVALTPGDIDGDGDVDITDLALVLASFGCQSPPAPFCDGDVDGDGDTDISDLALVLANFGM